MDMLFHPAYFSNIATFVGLVNSDKAVIEVHDNFQKQTFRNRTSIYAANGMLSLTIPVIYTQKKRQLYKDVKIANDGKWQAIHWKSLLSAYRTSPFFEFYEDDLRPIFTEDFKYLMDFNLKGFEVICDCLELNIPLSNSSFYKSDVQDKHDLRFLIDPKHAARFQCTNYNQVFAYKHGFINNLSILDLLFNEGPNCLVYLRNQDFNQLWNS